MGRRKRRNKDIKRRGTSIEFLVDERVIIVYRKGFAVYRKWYNSLSDGVLLFTERVIIVCRTGCGRLANGGWLFVEGLMVIC